MYLFVCACIASDNQCLFSALCLSKLQSFLLLIQSVHVWRLVHVSQLARKIFEVGGESIWVVRQHKCIYL